MSPAQTRFAGGKEVAKHNLTTDNEPDILFGEGVILGRLLSLLP